MGLMTLMVWTLSITILSQKTVSLLVENYNFQWSQWMDLFELALEKLQRCWTMGQTQIEST
jgi:hypothetical protein